MTLHVGNGSKIANRSSPSFLQLTQVTVQDRCQWVAVGELHCCRIADCAQAVPVLAGAAVRHGDQYGHGGGASDQALQSQGIVTSYFVIAIFSTNAAASDRVMNLLRAKSVAIFKHAACVLSHLPVYSLVVVTIHHCSGWRLPSGGQSLIARWPLSGRRYGCLGLSVK
jgi:hypothetical protein